MNKRKLQIQQMEEKLQSLSALKSTAQPPDGWVRGLRKVLGMTMLQLAAKMGTTKQSVLALEVREKSGSITLKTLKEAANAMDMELVYGFYPKDGSLDALIERKAREMAKEIVMRTSQTMMLEEQEVSWKRLNNAIDERTESIKNELPKSIWD